MKRTIQTIKPTAIMKNKEIIIIDDLREINVGTCENVLRSDLREKYPDGNKYIDETEH